MRLDSPQRTCYGAFMVGEISIPRALSSEAGFGKLTAILARMGDDSRAEIGRRVCAAFGFLDHRGDLQVASCLAALRRLERSGRIALPAPSGSGGHGRVARPGVAVPEPAGLPSRAGDIDGLELVAVRDDALRLVFNELMASEHPRAARLHVGRQVRYLAGSSHGWLGGFLFAPATRSLEARDEWIGWDADARERRLGRVISLARFLVRPSASVRNLASRLLGMAARRVSGDFEAAYGVRPVLMETYVAPEHSGSCFRAAGWRRVGETCGRRLRDGRAEPAKAVFLRPLAADWRDRLEGVDRALAAGDGLDTESWAGNEFGAASLGDARLTRRLVQSARVQARSLSRTFFGAAAGDEAAVKGYCRMIEHPDHDAVSATTILSGHRARSVRRMQAERLALLVQDGTDLNFATHRGCDGLGSISRNKGGTGTRGLHLHSTLAVGADGVPLGVVRMEFDAPPFGAAKPAKDVEDRKTGRWLRGLRDSAGIARELDGVRVVAAMDREADAFDVFAEHRALGRRSLELLVRARHDRSLGRGRPKLFETMAAQPETGRFTIELERQSERNSTRGQAAFDGRAARRAVLAIRTVPVDLPPPERERARFGPDPIAVNAVLAEEADPPAGCKPTCWRLLTTLEAGRPEQAREVLRLYGLRWRIEDWHRILKSGCNVENTAHRNRERLQRAVAMNAVIAWRIAALAQLARTEPGRPLESAFSKIEIGLLSDFAAARRMAPPADLGTAFRLVATMGGYLGRSNDGPPGAEILWNGQSSLAFAAWMVGHSVNAGDDSVLLKSIG